MTRQKAMTLRRAQPATATIETCDTATLHVERAPDTSAQVPSEHGCGGGPDLTEATPGRRESAGRGVSSACEGVSVCACVLDAHWRDAGRVTWKAPIIPGGSRYVAAVGEKTESKTHAQNVAEQALRNARNEPARAAFRADSLDDRPGGRKPKQ